MCSSRSSAAALGEKAKTLALHRSHLRSCIKVFNEKKLVPVLSRLVEAK
jgi:hypothetical protein